MGPLLLELTLQTNLRKTGRDLQKTSYPSLFRASMIFLLIWNADLFGLLEVIGREEKFSEPETASWARQN